MQPRRHLVLVVTALLLCVAALSSCGFNKATNKPYIQADGINYRQGPVWVLNAVVIAAQPGSGTLSAGLTNQSDTDSETLDAVAGGGGDTVMAATFSPISIAPMGYVDLSDSGVVTLTGNFGAGDVIPLSLSFKDGSTISMSVPVVYACQAYAGLDDSTSTSATSSDATSTDVPTTGGTKAAPTDTVTAAPTAITPISPSDSLSAAPSATTSDSASTDTASSDSGSSESASSSASPYVCGTDDIPGNNGS